MEISGETESTIEKRKSKLKNLLFGWIEDNYDKAFLVLLIIAFIIRLWFFIKTQDQAIWWDAADYLSTAKNWAGANPYMLDGWYYRRGFFWPLFGMLFFKLGLGEAGIRFSIVLFSTGIVLLSYFLIKEMFGKKLALWVSVPVAFSWIFLFFGGRPLTNIPATFFLLIALLFFWKGHVLKKGNHFVYLFGLFFALTCLTRMQYAVFAFPLIIFLFTKEGFKFLKNKSLWIAIAIFTIIFIPQFVMHSQHYGNPVLDLVGYYFGIESISPTGEVGGASEGNINYLGYYKNLSYILDGNNAGQNSLWVLSPFYVLFLIGGFLFFIDLVLGIDKLTSKPKVQKRLFILVWIILIFLFLPYVATHYVEQRYIMQTLPFLFLIAVFPFLFIEKFLITKVKINKKITPFIITAVLILLIIPNLLFANSMIESKQTSFLEVKQAGEWIKQNSELSDIVVSDSLPQTAYYSERPTYPFSLDYRRDLPGGGAEEFENFIKTKKPKYMILSVIAKSSEWSYALPEKYPGLVTPVQVYGSQEQPVLIIYAFNNNYFDQINQPNQLNKSDELNQSNQSISEDSL